MACRVFVAAINISNSVQKGAFSSVRDYLGPEQDLGPMSMPKWINIIITDADKAEIKALYLRQQWFIKFKHEVLGTTGNMMRIRTSVDDEFVNVSQTSKSVMKNSMIGFLQNEANATSITVANDSVTFDIVKQTDLPALKYKFADVFDTIFHARKFYVSESDVNTIIGMGGEIELTKAQFLTRLKNKLDD